MSEKGVNPRAVKAAAELDLLEQAEIIRRERNVPLFDMGTICLGLAAHYMALWEQEQRSPRPAARLKGERR